MIITSEQAESRLENVANLATLLHPIKESNLVDFGSTIIKKYSGGASHGEIKTHKLEDEEKINCGVLARTIGYKEAAEVFDISPRHALDLGQGRVGGRTGFSPEIKDAVDKSVDKVRETVEEVAINKLLTSLNLLDDEKIANSTAKDISSIASNLSRVASNMNPRDKESSGPKVVVVIHQPKVADESHFDIVEVG